MTVKELKEKLDSFNVDEDMNVVMFAKGEVFDVLDFQVFEGEFELGCGWSSRADQEDEDLENEDV